MSDPEFDRYDRALASVHGGVTQTAKADDPFPVDPDDCEHGVWNPDNGQCLDCGDMSEAIR